jgi:hypothetical protein
MISVMESRELQATVLALKQMDSTVRKAINAENRSQMVPEWREALATKASTSLEQRVLLGGTRVNLGPERVTLMAATSTKKMSGGASPQQIAAAVEFGAEKRQQKVGGRSRNGKPYTYNRRINRQFKQRTKTGFVAYPAAAELAPRFAALWVSTSIRKMHEALEGKAG